MVGNACVLCFMVLCIPGMDATLTECQLFDSIIFV